MKNLIILFLMTISFTLIEAKEKPKVKEVSFECSLDCHKCKTKIEGSIAYEKGVKYVNADVATKIVKIKYREDKNSEEDLKKALENLDFVVKKVEPKKQKN